MTWIELERPTPRMETVTQDKESVKLGMPALPCQWPQTLQDHALELPDIGLLLVGTMVLSVSAYGKLRQTDFA